MTQIWNLNGRSSVRSSLFFSLCFTTFIRGLDAKDDSSSTTIDQRRNFAFQKKVSGEVTEQMNALISLLSEGLNIHLNIGQEFNVRTPSVFMSTEILSTDALMNKEIQFVSNARIRLPTMFNRSVNRTERTSLRVRFFFFFLLFRWKVMMIMSSLVHLRTFGFFRSIEYESLHVDLVDSTRSRWKSTFS